MIVKKNITLSASCFLVMILSMAAALWPVITEAGTTRDVVFSWIPNTESYLAGYEIYCDKKTQKNNPHKHALWRSAVKNNIKGGRVIYRWKNFPSLDDRYCVAVAIARHRDGSKLVSDFSTELKVTKRIPPRTISPPGELKSFSIDINVTVTP